MTQSLSVSTTQTRDWIACFWAWWVGELKATVPGQVRQWFLGRKRNAAWLKVVRDGMTIESLQGGRIVSRPFEVSPARASMNPASLPGGIIRLDAALVFEASLTLPLSAESNLRQILGHHIGLIVPLDPAMLAYDHVVIGRDSSAQTLHIAVAVAKRATLEQARHAALQAGFSPTAAVIDRAGKTDNRFDLLRHDRKVPAARNRHVLLRAMEVAALLMMLAAGGIQLRRADAEREQLVARIGEMRMQAEAGTKLQHKADLLADSVTALQARIGMRAQMAVLAEITRILPDDTWLTFFRFYDGSIELIGNSRRAASLIGSFEHSSSFGTPHFQSPVTTNTDGSEHFDLVVSAGRSR